MTASPIQETPLAPLASETFNPGAYLYHKDDVIGRDGNHVVWHQFSRRKIEKVTAKTVFLGPAECMTWPEHTPPTVEQWTVSDLSPQRFLLRSYDSKFGVKLGLASYDWTLEPPDIPHGPIESLEVLRDRMLARQRAYAAELQRRGYDIGADFYDVIERYVEAARTYRATVGVIGEGQIDAVGSFSNVVTAKFSQD